MPTSSILKTMAKLVVGMNVSLDGYVDHMSFVPSPALFRHFVEEARAITGSLYGRGMYEIMSYWDENQADWGPEEKDYAEAWKSKPKWVASRTLTQVGPNATLISNDLATAVSKLKAEQNGEIEVAGPKLAQSLAAAGLIDEYQLYLHPVVLGSGNPFFAGPRPPLRLVSHEEMAGGVLRLKYVPA